MFLFAPVVFAAEPVTLSAAVSAARGSAPDARALDAREQVAHADAWSAIATVLPQLGGTYTYLHNDQEIALDFGGMSIVVQKQDVHNAAANLSQVLFSGAAFGRVAVTGQLAKAAEATHDAAALDLDLRVATVWLTARAAGELRAATAEVLDDAQKHEAVAKVALGAGTVTPLAAEKARVAVLDASTKLIDATRTEADALGQLGELVGRDVTIADVPLPLDDVPPAEDDLVQRALAHRPELLAARAQLAAAKAGTWDVVGDWAPTVSAIGAYKFTNSPMFTDQDTSWYVGINASLPVLDGGRRFADARRVNANRDAADAALEKLELATKEDVRAALRAERASRESLDLARAQEDTATQARALAESQFAAGTATALDVEDAQSAVLGARVSRIRAEAQWLAARWQRGRLCGETIDFG